MSKNVGYQVSLEKGPNLRDGMVIGVSSGIEYEIQVPSGLKVDDSTVKMKDSADPAVPLIDFTADLLEYSGRPYVKEDIRSVANVALFFAQFRGQING